ncbi:hypothetical protein LG634_22115 [Streptomyces bambusae]|uniref:hypothetical protein n=1 Tax=Streptomyces bambusae TaxID=1550616 RepID=UPI001CFC8161|nr:hypothetical protein [Streptomyces bambusae]MCB5167512.1 hypothetical protein [Streptomyces bambusae]
MSRARWRVGAVVGASVALLAALGSAAGLPTARTGAVAQARACSDGTVVGGTGGCARYGPAARLGGGTVRTFSTYEGGVPKTLGVSLTAGAVAGLPTAANDGRHCFDADADGHTDGTHECVGGHSLELALPAGSAGLPFRWVLLNWNPHGHNPHGRYDVAHFDVHFYLVPPEVRAGIRTGRCALLIACDQLAEAAEPVPAAYLPAGYPASSPQTAEGAMGAHLDSRPPSDGTLRGQTFIYGAYGGGLVFMEPMVTRDLLLQQRTGAAHRTCEPVPQPAAWRTPGWYPTRYCTAYRAAEDDYTVSLTDFVHSAAAHRGWPAGR